MKKFRELGKRALTKPTENESALRPKNHSTGNVISSSFTYHCFPTPTDLAKWPHGLPWQSGHGGKCLDNVSFSREAPFYETFIVISGPLDLLQNC
jgi:hypothetical protein